MRTITIRNVPPDLARELEEAKRQRGRSLNQTVLELLGEAVGHPYGRRRNGLAALAGSWSERDHDAFERAVEPMEQVDEELWR